MHRIESDAEISNVLRPQLDFLRESLLRVANFIFRRDHGVNFTGRIAVGKTTALCHIAGLLIQKQGGVRQNAVLDTGAGRTTLCEVHLRSGPQYGIIVDPFPDREISLMVEDLCAGLLESKYGAVDLDSKGVSRELDRALRNMAGLPRKPERGPDGKVRNTDPARDLLGSDTTHHSLCLEFAKRLELWKRTEREILV